MNLFKRIFRDKTQADHLKKLIGIMEETEHYQQKTIKIELSALPSRIDFMMRQKEQGDHVLAKTFEDHINHKLEYIKQQEEDLEKLRAEILENYKKLIREME